MVCPFLADCFANGLNHGVPSFSWANFSEFRRKTRHGKRNPKSNFIWWVLSLSHIYNINNLWLGVGYFDVSGVCRELCVNRGLAIRDHYYLLNMVFKIFDVFTGSRVPRECRTRWGVFQRNLILLFRRTRAANKYRDTVRSK